MAPAATGDSDGVEGASREREPDGPKSGVCGAMKLIGT